MIFNVEDLVPFRGPTTSPNNRYPITTTTNVANGLDQNFEPPYSPNQFPLFPFEVPQHHLKTWFQIAVSVSVAVSAEPENRYDIGIGRGYRSVAIVAV